MDTNNIGRVNQPIKTPINVKWNVWDPNYASILPYTPVTNNKQNSNTTKTTPVQNNNVANSPINIGGITWDPNYASIDYSKAISKPVTTPVQNTPVQNTPVQNTGWQSTQVPMSLISWAKSYELENQKLQNEFQGLINDIMANKYWTGATRKKNLESMWYNYAEIQNYINQMLNNKKRREVTGNNTFQARDDFAKQNATKIDQWFIPENYTNTPTQQNANYNNNAQAYVNNGYQWQFTDFANQQKNKGVQQWLYYL